MQFASPTMLIIFLYIQIRLCIALKAPLHQELKMLKLEQEAEKMKSEGGDNEHVKPEQVLDTHRLK